MNIKKYKSLLFLKGDRKTTTYFSELSINFLRKKIKYSQNLWITRLIFSDILFIIKYSILPKNLYKYEESIISPGAVNICWLGFYSMLNIRYFSEEYISAPYGLYKNRWGDQQFFIPTLFGYGFSNFSYFNKNTYLCTWT